MQDYNERELKNKIDAFLTRKLSERLGSPLGFKADYLDRTKAVAALLLTHSRTSARIRGLSPFRKEHPVSGSASRYLAT
ncbi:hypothetical protein RAAC3_TM7C00001G0139 [Candidatus Saccharibacteria bacterium RAAC3_TM7_1]|nr:hypothetical protein RAAC3_TM7C00001G0139 [Candidatus Saccharibacteria bacterium RAAC3_TM7_1]